MKIKSVYTNADNRQRAYCIEDDGTTKVISYPRILMEQKLGRPLEPYEDVHHIDGNKLNNSLSNLEVILHGDHQRLHSQKYFDKLAVCDVCGKEFLWTGKRQGTYHRDIRRGRKRIISCSKKCSGTYGRREQLRRNS